MYGSPKSSGGSTPSESSGDSAPAASSSGGSGGGYNESGSSGSSGDGCSFYIQIVLYVADDQMQIFLFNNGDVPVTVTDVTGVALLTPSPAFPTMPPGTGADFIVDSSGTDLRGTTFTVHSSCGDRVDTFPLA